MRKISKIFCSLSLCVALCIISVVSAFATPSERLTAYDMNWRAKVTVDKQEAEVGDLITMTLTLRGIKGASSGDVFISYDDESLKFLSKQIYPLTDGVTAEGGKHVEIPCTVSYVFYSTEPLEINEAVAATYTFKVLKKQPYGFRATKCDIESASYCADGEHIFSDVIMTKAQTCVADGEGYKQCEKCGYIENVTFPKKNHNFLNYYTQNGAIWAHCGFCGLNKRTEYIFGDVDCSGVITAIDARKALRFSAKLENPTDVEFFLCDIDRSGKISAADARKILRVSAKLEKFSF